MSMEHGRPGERITSFTAGLLSGNMFEQGELINKLSSNFEFRIESAREMMTGMTDEQSVSPVERRSMIMQRRRVALGIMDESDSSADSTTTSTSGNIGETGRRTVGSGSGTVESSTPNMSDVDKGTKARAQDRGFGN